MIAHLELNEGTFYPQGGMIAIPQALHRLCVDMGVQCHFGTEVTDINREQNEVFGITTNDATMVADKVVVASDVHHVYRHLLNDATSLRKLDEQESSDSAFVFYWGIGKSFPKLHLHNIFFAPQNDHRRNVYVNITSKLEPGVHAPAHGENWFTMLVVPAGDSSAPEMHREYALAQTRKMLGEEVAEHIEVEHVLTPRLIEQGTFSHRGALYGTASNHPMAAFRRHPNRHPRIRNLFFCGGTVHPGGGIPLCLRSGRIVADMVLRES